MGPGPKGHPPAWKTAQRHGMPLPGEIAVCALDLALHRGRLAELEGLLNAEEKARAARYLDPLAARRFTACRGQLREVLGACLEKEPQELRFTCGHLGKPALAGAESPPLLHFNLTHSRDLGLLAVSLAGPLGIDLEFLQIDFDHLAVARRYFGPSESAALEGMGQAERAAAFCRIWTRKEALLKGWGCGLSELGPAAIVFPCLRQPLSPPPSQGEDSPLYLHDIDLAHQGYACLATPLEHPAIRFWKTP